MKWNMWCVFGLGLITAMAGTVDARDYVRGNRHMHLDEHEVYYPSRAFPKLTTPSWFGEPGVEAVIILSIDDMRATKKYADYLAPIDKRLKELENGRSPMSIMTNQVPPDDPQLQQWLRDGVSIEVHTTTHPCPLLQKQDLERAADDVVSCIAGLNKIPNNRAIAFRMPCCDSMNSVSPRFFREIFNRRTEAGDFMTIDSSVFMLLTGADRELDRDLVVDAAGNNRFEKYVQFRNFVNFIENYPYPYVIGNTVWEFPCIVPSDWEGQHRNGKNAAETVEDLQRAIAAVVAKKGVFTLVYHPHGWIKAEQVVELIDFAHRKYGRKVRFASFADAQKRIDKHLLGGWPIKSSEGGDNGVRLLDLNQDGHLDVVIGSGKRRETRIWDGGLWRVTKGGPAIVNTKGRSRQVKFVEIQDNGMASALLRRKKRNVLMHFDGKRWSEPQPADNAVVARSALFRSVQPGHDAGVRARDVNGDGYTDLVINNATDNDLLLWQTSRNRWSPASFRLPKPGLIVDDQGRDRGLRFVDLNRDQRLDLVCSNEDGYFVRLFTDAKHGWSKVTLEGKPDDPDALPLIVRNGTDNGVWFNDGAMFIQNEITGDTKDRSAKRELPVGR